MARGFLLWVRTEIATILTLGGLVCVATVVAMASTQLAALDSRLTQVLTAKESTVQTATTNVTVTVEGVEHVITVSTTKDETETTAQWMARHKAAILAAVALGSGG